MGWRVLQSERPSEAQTAPRIILSLKARKQSADGVQAPWFRLNKVLQTEKGIILKCGDWNLGLRGKSTKKNATQTHDCLTSSDGR